MALLEDLVLDPKRRVLKVVEAGFEVNFSDSVPLRRYYRSLNEIVRMANVYLEECSYEAALKLFTRFSCILLEYLPKHPDYSSDTSAEKVKARQKLKDALNSAETIKKKLLKQYEAEAEVLRKKKEERLTAAKAICDTKDNATETGNRAAETAYPSEIPIVNTNSIEFPELNSGVSTEPSASPLPPGLIDSDLNPPLGPGVVPPRNTKPNYPSVTGISGGAPAVDRSQKPSEFNAATVGVSYVPQNRYGLRTVVIPQMLVKQFLQLADSNTSKNIETVGILAGKLAQNKFLVTHLIIPKQSATPDSCDKEDDVLVCEFQDKHDLITVGWIHTHPSQTAFLSSVDLHTHYPYQLLLPEAVAVVCSTKFQETGIFMLNPDFGMKQIGSCSEVGFHPHQQHPPLFENCPHAAIADGYQATVIDFRNV